MFEYESAEQREIRSSVRRLAETEVPKFQDDRYHGTVPLDLFKSISALGLAGLSVDEEFGGLAAGPTTTAIVMEELARVDLGPAIFVSVHNMVSGLINKFAKADQKKTLLPDLASGKKLAAFCLTEPSAGSDASGIRTSFTEEPKSFRMSGEKCYITSAGWADLYLVFARRNGSAGRDGITAFVVEADRPGIVINKPEQKMGCELSPIASLTFDNVEIPHANLIGEISRGYEVALGGLAGGRINIAACANGLSKAAINIALAHLKERKQFGQSLIEFQGLQFMLADMHMRLEAAELLTWQAARTLEQEPQSRSNRLYPSEAKCFATDAAMSITTDAVQLLGGAGYIKEYRVEKLMRDAKMLQIVEGTNQIQRGVIAKELARAERL